MEKLIPLLNEKTWKEWVLETSSFGEDWLFLKWHPEVNIKEEKLISKKYWFIKRLVENNKIDDDKCDVINDIYNDELPSKYTRYDAILMWLAIQDEPIEFLISILK